MFVLFSFQSYAQTGIGTTTPNASAKLDVSSSTMGFLPPRVTLTAANTFSPIVGTSSAAAGLLVYNTNTAGTIPNNVVPGYYYWSGTSWIRLIVPTDNASNVTGTVAVANGGTGTNTGSITGTGALTFTAGGTNQNINLTPSGTGNIILRNNVGIGTTTPSTSQHIENGNNFGSDPGNTTSPSLYVYNTNSASTTAHSTATIRTNGSGGGNPYLSFDINGIRGYSMGIDNADLDKFKFHTNWNLNNSVAPAFTVTTENRVGIGTVTPASRFHIQSSDANSLYIESTTSDNNGMFILNANTNQSWSNNWHEFVYFQKQGTTIGSISGTSNGAAVLYNTTSDYRLKTDLKKFNGLDLIKKIKTYDYAWKSNNSRMYGVMAHELQEVLPYAVSGKKDAVDKEGKIIPQAVDYSKLTPILVKAIQEQDMKMKLLEERILQLEKLLNK